MLKRFYANNFKTLVNFELRFDAANLLLGPNGAGKSAVFDALFRLKKFITQNGTVADLFSIANFTHWQKSVAPIQSFELDLEGNGGVYQYRLVIEHKLERALVRMQQEQLHFNGRPLFAFSSETGNAKLYRDDHSAGPEYPFDWSRSGIGALLERHDNSKLTWFKRRIERLFIVKLNPFAMGSESREETSSPDLDLSNYASWFRHLSQEFQSQVFTLTDSLRQVLSGFHAFKLNRAGEAKILAVGFSDPTDKLVYYKFDLLSEGQRALIALYTLLHCLSEKEATLCIDEPENFLALPEVARWLTEVDARVQDELLQQTVLISHHPKIINFLAKDVGIWLQRDNGVGPTRVKPISMQQDTTGLPVSELINRGWIMDD